MSQVIWITGASSGIGEALAKHYAAKGAKIILSARNRDKLYLVKNQTQGNPLNIHVLPLDLEREEDLPKKAEEALKIFGRVDLLIHAAGVSQRALALETSDEVEKKIMAINYRAVVRLSKLILPSMINYGNGHLVVMSSLMGKIGTPYRSSYAASKHALHGYFECLRAEVYDKNIRITLVCPGFIDTSISEKALTKDGRPYGEKDPAHKRAMSVDEFIKKLTPKIDRQEQEIYIGGKELSARWASVFIPKYFRKKIRTIDVF